MTNYEHTVLQKRLKAAKTLQDRIINLRAAINSIERQQSWDVQIILFQKGTAISTHYGVEYSTPGWSIEVERKLWITLHTEFVKNLATAEQEYAAL